MPKAGDKEQYRQQYPNSEKWIHQCVICQTEGYKPEMPEQIGVGMLAQNLRKFYNELKLNEMGFCETCAKHYENRP